MKKHRWHAWDSNPGRQDGKRRQFHWAMAAPPCHIIICNSTTLDAERNQFPTSRFIGHCNLDAKQQISVLLIVKNWGLVNNRFYDLNCHLKMEKLRNIREFWGQLWRIKVLWALLKEYHRYAEIKQSDWFKLVTWLVISNQNALFEHSNSNICLRHRLQVWNYSIEWYNNRA